jgi:hypothetical protein
MHDELLLLNFQVGLAIDQQSFGGVKFRPPLLKLLPCLFKLPIKILLLFDLDLLPPPRCLSFDCRPVTFEVL